MAILTASAEKLESTIKAKAFKYKRTRTKIPTTFKKPLSKDMELAIGALFAWGRLGID